MHFFVQFEFKRSALHQPGIEPGWPAWQASILPLNHRCLHISRTIKREFDNDLMIVTTCFASGSNSFMTLYNILVYDIVIFILIVFILINYLIPLYTNVII